MKELREEVKYQRVCITADWREAGWNCWRMGWKQECERRKTHTRFLIYLLSFLKPGKVLLDYK
jgi:hypothetical protein